MTTHVVALSGGKDSTVPVVQALDDAGLLKP